MLTPPINSTTTNARVVIVTSGERFFGIIGCRRRPRPLSMCCALCRWPVAVL